MISSQDHDDQPTNNEADSIRTCNQQEITFKLMYLRHKGGVPLYGQDQKQS